MLCVEYMNNGFVVLSDAHPKTPNCFSSPLDGSVAVAFNISLNDKRKVSFAVNICSQNI